MILVNSETDAKIKLTVSFSMIHPALPPNLINIISLNQETKSSASLELNVIKMQKESAPINTLLSQW